MPVQPLQPTAANQDSQNGNPSHKERMRVMIVDDEMLIRGLIRRRVNWDAIGMEIVAEAASAGEALAVLDEVRPDIIFTDICMPILDGIAFSRMVMERNPAIRIVIVTGHDEFEYAKSCIKIGVSDFLLKPLRAEELTQTAVAIRDRILEERRQADRLASLQRQQDILMPSAQENALLCLITDCGPVEEALPTLRDSGAFPYPEASFQVMAVELNPASLGDHSEIMNRQLTAKALHIARRIFREHDGVHMVADGPQRVAIVSGNPAVSLDQYGDVMLTQLINGCHCHVSIGISLPVPAADQLAESYRDACRALAAKVALGPNRVIHIGDLNAIEPHETETPYNQLEQIYLFLQGGLEEKAIAWMEEQLDRIQPGDTRSLAILRREALALVLTCSQATQSKRRDEDQKTSRDPSANHILSSGGGSVTETSSRWIEQVLEIDNVPQMKAFLGDIISQVVRLHIQRTKTVSDSFMEKVLAYLHAHMGDATLSLSGTAANFFVSPSHLSRLFRKETGCSFVEYVTRERMRQAFELVTQSDMKSCDIGRQVGIDDPHYFSILFKKHTGMSVHECRKR